MVIAVNNENIFIQLFISGIHSFLYDSIGRFLAWLLWQIRFSYGATEPYAWDRNDLMVQRFDFARPVNSA